VWKARILSQTVPHVIDGLKHSKARMNGTFTLTLPDGTTRPASNEEAISAVLDEFYNTVQIMIGEAISVSELKEFLATIPRETASVKSESIAK
jgi:hypothetical protein